MIHGLPPRSRALAPGKRVRLDGRLHRRHERRDRGDLAGGPERRADSDQAVIPRRLPVRASILLWSTASGVILGLFIDATLIGVALLLSAVIPGISARLHYRWLRIAASTVLVVIPLAMSVLGVPRRAAQGYLTASASELAAIYWSDAPISRSCRCSPSRDGGLPQPSDRRRSHLATARWSTRSSPFRRPSTITPPDSFLVTARTVCLRRRRRERRSRSDRRATPRT